MKKIFLIRHGETEWSLTGQHTGITDIPLTENGKKQAHLLAERLKKYNFHTVFVSPMQRSYQTCTIAGLANRAIIEPNLIEWNYGKYEGMTSKEIRKNDPQWNIFLNGAPDGESVSDIKHRATQLLHAFEHIQGNIALFSHGHFLRALACCFIELSVAEGRHFSLFPASTSILANENAVPCISLWNDISYLV